MSMTHIDVPDLSNLVLGDSQLHLLENVGFSSDSKLMLVKATFTDNGDPIPGSLHYGYFLFDLEENEYVLNVNQALLGNTVSATQDLLQVVISGDKESWQLIAEVESTDEFADSRLYRLTDNGVLSNDILNEITGTPYAVNYEKLLITADSRFLALQTTSANLALDSAPDTNDSPDIYLVDLHNNQITRVSYVANSEVSLPTYLADIFITNENKLSIAMITDAAYVSPSQVDKNSAEQAENSKSDLYIWQSNINLSGLVGEPTFSLISKAKDGTASGYIDKDQAVSITESGVFFSSTAANLVLNDFNNSSDIFLYKDEDITRVSLLKNQELAGGAMLAGTDDSGQSIVGLTKSTELIEGSPAQQLVHFNQYDGEVKIASATDLGIANGWVINGLVSPNGADATFVSSATNLSVLSNHTIQGDLFVISVMDNQIQGIILDRKGQELTNVSIKQYLSSDADAAAESATDEAGSYFLMLAQRDGYVELDSNITYQQTSAISVYDALDALKMAIGLTPSIDSQNSYALIAADIDQSGDVSVYDALDILKAAIGLQSNNAPKWVFVDKTKDYDAITASEVVYDNNLQIADLDNSLTIDFTGILLGDVDASYTLDII